MPEQNNQISKKQLSLASCRFLLFGFFAVAEDLLLEIGQKQCRLLLSDKTGQGLGRFQLNRTEQQTSKPKQLQPN
jgi:hypothetical protein